MDANSHKEEFSYAYVHAVAAAAGYACQKGERLIDLDGVDLTITATGIHGTRKRPRLDLQVKCTSRTDILDKEQIRFPLEISAYENLRFNDPHLPCLLVIVLVPQNLENWISQSQQELCLRHCGYWYSLIGAPPTPNKESITVKVPRANVLTPSSLKQFMQRLGNGEAL